MKQTFTLLILGVLCFGGNAIGQCSSSASNYDLIVASTIVRSGSSAGYTQGFVCNGGVLIDSATCCTRFVVVDSGGSMIVGPQSYGAVYVLNGGSFNGQNMSNNWQVFAEPNAAVTNHTGTTIACAQITYTASNCIMSIAQNATSVSSVTVTGADLNFTFASAVDDVTITLYDINGRMVRCENVVHSTTHSMRLEGLAGGAYMYRVTQGGEVISSDKIILTE
jgi:hypothetical protein